MKKEQTMLTQLDEMELRQKIQANQHEVFVVSMDEMEAIIRSSPNGKKESVQDAWLKIKEK
jgi:D-ribose pyranose/furanose isomerase RbsD